jgi:hypothetical protein
MLNRLLLAVERSGFLKGNLDYHLIRAYIPAVRISEVVRVRSSGADPLYR